MGELNANAEIARHLDEHARHAARRREEILEILEATLLALVAAITAWCGYQATKFDSERESDYSMASRLRVEAEQLYLRSGQVLAYDAGTFNA